MEVKCNYVGNFKEINNIYIINIYIFIIINTLLVQMFNNENEEIIAISNIDDYISSLSNEDVISKLTSLTKLCECKINEMQSLFTEISTKEDKINKLTTSSSSSTTTMCGYHSTFNEHNNKNDHHYDSFKNEEHELRKEFQHNINQLEKEYQQQLEKDLNDIDTTYKNELNKIINEHDIKVKNLHYEIQRLQTELEELKEGNGDTKYITKIEHNNKMNKMFNEHVSTIEMYDKQIQQLERNILSMYPMKVNANVNGIELSFMKDECGGDCSIINEEQVKQREELFVAQLNKIKEINKDNGSIILLSQLNNNCSSSSNYNYNKPRESMFVVPTENSEFDCNECVVEDDNDNITNEIRSENYLIHLSNIPSNKKC